MMYELKLALFFIGFCGYFYIFKGGRDGTGERGVFFLLDTGFCQRVACVPMEKNEIDAVQVPPAEPELKTSAPVYICMVGDQIVAAETPRGPQLLLCQDAQGVARLSEMAQHMVNSVQPAQSVSGSVDLKIALVRFEPVAVERVFQRQLVRPASAGAVPNIRSIQ